MDLDFSPIAENWRFFATGLGVTVVLSVVSAASSILAGLVIALLRLYGPRWLRPLLVFYIDSMRAIPGLVVLGWIYFAFPILVGLNFAPFWAALVALTLHIAAYAAAASRGVGRGGDRRRHRVQPAGPDPGRIGAGHVARADLAQGAAAAGHDPHVAGLWLDPDDGDQGHGHRLRDRGAGTDAQGGNRGRPELPPGGGVQCRDAGVFPDPVSGPPWRRPAVPAPGASGPLLRPR